MAGELEVAGAEEARELRRRMADWRFIEEQPRGYGRRSNTTWSPGPRRGLGGRWMRRLLEHHLEQQAYDAQEYGQVEHHEELREEV
ncbi:hypothetical protein PABY_07040 [Pyrodictium abyssi]|uniref:Uncharacterized protein n=1 Tax=Pyrodictium abyssi TaxID=54256 RepID=A0ABM8IUB6_9CREN|nr:hypothetical protein PABY_07040 [Pyrodictium abyssi]